MVRSSFRATKSGAGIPIEERDALEVTARFRARNPAFDVTPGDLITAIVTEQDVHEPPFQTSLSRAPEVEDERLPRWQRQLQHVGLAAGLAAGVAAGVAATTTTTSSKLSNGRVVVSGSNMRLSSGVSSHHSRLSLGTIPKTLSSTKQRV